MKTSYVESALCALAVLVSAGCADLPDQKNAGPHEARQYRTGSNIAVKDYGAMSDVKAVDPDAVRQARDHSIQMPPPTGTGGR